MEANYIYQDPVIKEFPADNRLNEFRTGVGCGKIMTHYIAGSCQFHRGKDLCFPIAII